MGGAPVVIAATAATEEEPIVKREIPPEEAEVSAKKAMELPTAQQHALQFRKQRKVRTTDFAQRRSRKPQYAAMRRPIRYGSRIYHAYNLKAMYLKTVLKDERVMRRLLELHQRRPDFAAARLALQPPSPSSVAPPRPSEPFEVEWPSDVTRITVCLNPGNVKFKDISDLGWCFCYGDCFGEDCENATAIVYGTPTSCNLSVECSNAIRESPHLHLFDTGISGLGVYTTATLEVSDIIGKCCGVLHELDGVRPGIPPAELHQNSGYTLLLNAKSKRGFFVFIEPFRFGSIFRFLNHSCKPNAIFVEMQHCDKPKVVIMMLKTKRAGIEITVHYGDAMWFHCKCPGRRSKVEAQAAEAQAAQQTPQKKRKT